MLRVPTGRILQICFFLLLLFPPELKAQESKLFDFKDSSIHYNLYKRRWIIDIGTGFNSTHLSYNLKYDGHGKVNMIPNTPFVFQAGVHYLGVRLGLTFKLPVNTLNPKLYGKSNYLNLDLGFAIKRINFAVDINYFKGFAYLNQQAADTVALTEKHGIHPDYTTATVGLHVRYFFRKGFHYKAFQGKVADYKRSSLSPYIYGYLGGIGISNEKNYLLSDFQRTVSEDNSNMNRLGSFELGAIPGLAYVYKKDWFQGGILAGFGPLLQVKSYKTPDNSRGFLGLSTRTDLMLVLGVQKTKWFLNLSGEFQFRRINIKNINFQQYYFDVRLSGGYRFKEKTRKKKK